MLNWIHGCLKRMTQSNAPDIQHALNRLEDIHFLLSVQTELLEAILVEQRRIRFSLSDTGIDLNRIDSEIAAQLESATK